MADAVARGGAANRGRGRARGGGVNGGVAINGGGGVNGGVVVGGRGRGRGSVNAFAAQNDRGRGGVNAAAQNNGKAFIFFIFDARVICEKWLTAQVKNFITLT